MIPGIPTGFDWKKWGPWLVGIFVVLSIVGGFTSFTSKTKLHISKQQLEISEAKSASFQEASAKYADQVKNLKEQIDSEKSKNIRRIRTFNDQGVLVKEEYENQMSVIESVNRQLTEALNTSEQRAAKLESELQMYKVDAITDVEKEVVKRQGFRILVGGGLSESGDLDAVAGVAQDIITIPILDVPLAATFVLRKSF